MLVDGASPATMHHTPLPLPVEYFFLLTACPCLCDKLFHGRDGRWGLAMYGGDVAAMGGAVLFLLAIFGMFMLEERAANKGRNKRG